jgi:predicted membrane metal-binding protein
MHMLAISGQHVAILAAVIYFALGFFAIPITIRAPVTIGLLTAMQDRKKVDAFAFSVLVNEVGAGRL